MHAAGLIYDESFHYLDHLGPFCALMGWPLITYEPSIAEKARTFYPDLFVKEQSIWDPLPKTIVSCEPRALIRSALNVSNIETFWLPHGNSDKGWNIPFFEALEEGERALVYGQKMIDFMEAKNVSAKKIPVGNFRWRYYQKQKTFYETFQRTLQIPEDKTVFLYAPTWEDQEGNGSFSDCFPHLLDHLPQTAHLLIKFHPNTYRTSEIQIEQWMGECEGKNNITFLPNFPPIYPLLEKTDVYIGDMSSIGYDFLKFQRPMFFIHKNQGQNPFLYRCGRALSFKEIPSLFSMAKENPFENIQKEIYLYTFGPDETSSLSNHSMEGEQKESLSH